MNLNSSFMFILGVHSSTNTKWYFFIISKHTSFSTTFSLVFTKTENQCVFFFFSELQAFSRSSPWLIYGAAAWVVVVFNKKYFPKNHKARPAFPDRRAAFHIESPAMPWPPIFSIQRRSESSLISGRRLLSSLPVVLSLALWWHHQLAVALMGGIFPALFRSSALYLLRRRRPFLRRVVRWLRQL